MTSRAPGTRPRLVLVSGFLGAGKTTTLAALARLYERRGHRVAVVTNDQGRDLVDTRVAAAAGVSVGEVSGGCFCCRFEDLTGVVARAVDEHGADTVLAEAVGSCTDLSATVVRPLRRAYADRLDVAPVVAVLDPVRYAALGRALPLGDPADDVAYLFDRQLADADIVAVNKIDALPRGQGDGLRHELRARCPDSRVVAYSARSGDGLAALADALAGPAPPERELAIDYDRYAAAEAGLAWLNHTVTLTPAAADAVPSASWGAAVLSDLSATAARNGWDVGHAKVLVQPAGRHTVFTKLSVVAAGDEPSLDVDGGAMARATGWLNVRMACAPEELDAAVADAVLAADTATGAASAAVSGPASFAPAYPRPRHRIPAPG
ncbi:CobW/HypB/UreG family nucleotide-binding protein [Haloactinopolyspora alba]|uniref:CobW/HypB/UreG family nucleotide-binding protein n=1 Tax=Haloactinopolyspora alba TaxID=648780 RepID=A0A2P8E922_9ACTN|nr:GTP-binding protein [Haloactinopolyspora alba]PSL05963.1 CobW/HypB/UreG family nucleotide-binding protein [Haloactinopolyspora alba]